MSGLELLVDDIDGRLHAAIIEKTVLTNLYIDPVSNPAAWASLYLGKIEKLDKNLNAAIVDLGGGLKGILQAKHAGAVSKGGNTGDIVDILKPGQMIMVQIKAEAKNTSLHEKHKLPRLTTKIYLPGQSLIYSPLFVPPEPVKTMKNREMLEILSKLKGPGGWIAQRHTEKASADDLEVDSARLLSQWQALQEKAGADQNTPRLLKIGPNALERVLLDYGSDAFEHIYVGNKDILGMMTDWCAKYNPLLASSKRLRVFRPEKPEQRLFDIHDVYGAMEVLGESIVHLPCGGSIIIEYTHAVTVIDVNQGSAPNAAAANQDAVLEVARQTRLRGINGALLVDFINMKQKLERSRLMDSLTVAFAGDSCNAEVHGFTRLGIIEITRKRRTAMLVEKLKK